MRKILDFEIHSRYSRACSAALTLPNINSWAKRKGIDIIGTGDFTHPKWFSEIQENLVEDGNGLLRLKSEFELHDRPEAKPGDVRFLLSAEVSSIYSHNGKTRRIHNLLLAPSIEVVKKIQEQLEKRGAKLAADGRPIVGLSSKNLLEIVLEVSEDCMLIPAHVWTPYFGLFGSMSGYDSVEECFEDLSPHIYALETGLSADPEMFWRISKFDRFTLVSCSDPHSLPRIGRECNLLDLEENDLTYKEITRIIKEGDRSKFKHTLEYYPEEGRYHYDGHAECKVSLHPNKTKKLKGLCPVCGKKLTIGVLSRAEELADRPEAYIKEQPIPGKHFVVLEEIISSALGKGVSSKAVQSECLRMTGKYSEYEILFDLDDLELLKVTSEKVVEAIHRMRDGNVEVVPGYDGEYGKIKLFDSSSGSAESAGRDAQQSLFE
jgi:uncharacterized protein (TIGR00375 family)